MKSSKFNKVNDSFIIPDSFQFITVCPWFKIEDNYDPITREYKIKLTYEEKRDRCHDKSVFSDEEKDKILSDHLWIRFTDAFCSIKMAIDNWLNKYGLFYDSMNNQGDVYLRRFRESLSNEKITNYIEENIHQFLNSLYNQLINLDLSVIVYLDTDNYYDDLDEYKISPKEQPYRNYISKFRKEKKLIDRLTELIKKEGELNQKVISELLFGGENYFLEVNRTRLYYPYNPMNSNFMN